MTPTEKQSGLTGLAQVLRTVAALLLMCDPRDLGVAITEDVSRETGSFEPDLFLFDNYPGGIGQSQPLFQMRGKLLAGALEVLQGCACETGCPGVRGADWRGGRCGEGGHAAAAWRAQENLLRSY